MKPKSAGIPIKQLILDLELAYIAACKARKLASQLFVKAKNAIQESAQKPKRLPPKSK